MAKHIGNGAVFYDGDATTGTAVAQVRSISGPGQSRSKVDTTTLDATQYKTFLVGLIDGGDVTIELLYDPANATHKALLAEFVAATGGLGVGTIPTWAIKFPDTGTNDWEFTGNITGVEVTTPESDVITLSVTFSLTGSISYPP